ncbi:MAG: lysophospholipid acyltransferase family protein [Deltaproteobacteria bacterium]|nr:lysophospholipid acyltransferase family protein [Deltaproteobacteria bacterium]
MASRFAASRKFELSLSKFLQMNWIHSFFRFLPTGICQGGIRGLGRLYYLVNRREQTLIRETIRRVFQGKISAARLQRKIRAAFTGIFDHYFEKFLVGYANFPKLINFLRKRVRFQGREQLQEALAAGRGVILVTGHFGLQEALAAGRGVILVTGHFGAVELLPGALTVHGFPTSMICRFQSTRLRSAQDRRAQKIGLDLIEPDRGKGLWASLQALKAGRILIIECDEFESWRPDPRRGVHFLRHRLPADLTLELLHRRSGAPVVTALLQRDGHRRYTCQLTPVVTGAAPATSPISERCLEILETAVLTHPEQWYQWKEFGKMIKTHREVGYDHPEGGYLAPAPAISLPDQA